MKSLVKFIVLISCMTILSGCLYPESRLKQNQIPYEDQILSVQNAVNTYKEDNGGLLPIKNRDMETPIYHKYPIDFNKLIPRYIQDAPGSAYESGGVYLYVLVDVETDPTVKLLDLKVTEKIRDLKMRIDVFRQSNGYPPFKDVIAENVFSIDYNKLGLKEEPYVVSPFTGNNLPFVITNEIEIVVDYSIDLFKALQENNHPYAHGDDIRQLLVENSMFVPAHSLPYTIDTDKNEPIFFNK
ncbi:hypothetical protein LCL95_05665 [Bacillus timonensis]|nr:hypothetical protein [Bacillus timonensis]